MSKDILELILNELPFDVLLEYKFSKRKYRFDYFIDFGNNKGLAIEYDGITFTGNASGHQHFKGYVSNCNKQNLALSLGVPTLRYTCIQLEDPDKVKEEILKVIEVFNK